MEPPRSGMRIANCPAHVALIMDGNGRWANERGLPRTAGHEAGEAALMDTIAGALEAGVKYLSVYAFSTENWRRSPAEVRFLMGYSRQVLRRRRDQLDAWGVRVRWSGRRPRLWASVINELEIAQELTRNNDALNLVMCLNYGGQAELIDAFNSILAAGAPRRINAATLEKHLYTPDVPPVDLLIRTSGEQRLSNFLLWQCAYAEFAFTDTPWPEFNRHHLREHILTYLGRERRFGGAQDRVAAANTPQAGTAQV